MSDITTPLTHPFISTPKQRYNRFLPKSFLVLHHKWLRSFERAGYPQIFPDTFHSFFSSAVAYGNLLFIAGKGAHFEGDIKDHTKHVLDQIEKELIKNGSSMNKVLKVNVYLADLADYKKMNEMYRGRFGDNPPVRTTVATYGGVPGSSLVEIDCIAALE